MHKGSTQKLTASVIAKQTPSHYTSTTVHSIHFFGGGSVRLFLSDISYSTLQRGGYGDP